MQEIEIDIIPQSYTVHLDQPPEHRWDHVIEQNTTKLAKYAKSVKQIVRNHFSPAIANMYSCLSFAASHKPLPYEYKQELKGIAKKTQKVGLTYGDLVFMNVALDFQARCTSAVVSTADGQVHVRTLDWDIPELKSLVIDVSFCIGGAVVYQGVTFLGCVGLLTCMRPKAYSLSYNFRKPPTSAKTTSKFLLVKHLFNCFTSSSSISMTIRKIIELKLDYASVVKTVESGPFSGSGYIIICGTRIMQGKVVAYGDKGYSISASSNYMVQTNHDEMMMKVDVNWADGDDLLLNTIDRKDAFEKNLSTLRMRTEQSVFSAARHDPIINKDTIFLCLMNPGKSHMRTVIV
jgi:hypothetical protein